MKLKLALWPWFSPGLLVAGLLVLALRPRSQLVDVGVVHRGPLRVTVDEDGMVRVRERHVVSSPLAGTLSRPELKAGDAVQPDTVLARLVPVAPPLLDAGRPGPKSRPGRAPRPMPCGRRTPHWPGRAPPWSWPSTKWTGPHSLAKAGSISREALDRAELPQQPFPGGGDGGACLGRCAPRPGGRPRGLAADPWRRPAAQQEWTVTSPVRGVVLRVLQESEGVVQPGTPLFELGDTQALEVVSDLSTTDAVAVRPGQEVLIERWGGDRTLHARVRRVEPSAFTKVSALGVEEQRVDCVLADLTDSAETRVGLGDRYRVQVRVVTVDAPDLLLVPTGAAFRQGTGWAVFTVEEGRAHLRRVELGRRNDTDAEVLSGLTAGQQVALYPGEALRDGTRVEPR